MHARNNIGTFKVDVERNETRRSGETAISFEITERPFRSRYDPTECYIFFLFLFLRGEGGGRESLAVSRKAMFFTDRRFSTALSKPIYAETTNDETRVARSENSREVFPVYCVARKINAS